VTFLVLGLTSGPSPWAISTSPIFCDRIFQDKVSRTICPCWLWMATLLISASWVARITGVSHQHPASYITEVESGTWSLCVWLISLSIMTWNFIHVGKFDRISFHFKTVCVCVCVCVCVSHLLYPFVHGHLAYFHLLALVDDVAVNVDVRISLLRAAFKFVAVYPEVGYQIRWQYSLKIVCIGAH
jgi:hypothetical protein